MPFRFKVGDRVRVFAARYPRGVEKIYSDEVGYVTEIDKRHRNDRVPYHIDLIDGGTLWCAARELTLSQEFPRPGMSMREMMDELDKLIEKREQRELAK